MDDCLSGAEKCVILLKQKQLFAMKRKNFVSIADITREEIMHLIERARYFEENPNHKILDGKVVATLF